MLAGYHIILSTYGFWLPNDPRGSWSETLKTWELLKYGDANKTTERQSVAHVEHDHDLRRAAKQALKYPPVEFTGVQARAVARGFAEYVHRAKVTVWACAIMPSHIHIVTGPLHITAGQFAIQLKAAATRQLIAEDIHPFRNCCDSDGRPPKCFAKGEWKVFLRADDLLPAIRYVEGNPIKEGKQPQRWSFVVPCPFV